MILTFVPARLKSSRLPEKAIQKINGIASLERCLINASSISESSKIVLAISASTEDNELLSCNLDGKIDVIRGPEEDVLERIMPLIKRDMPDHIIRVTGDCPLVSKEIAHEIIDSHFKTSADVSYTTSPVPLGLAIEIYRTSAILKLKECIPITDYSEYLIYYFTNNREYFHVNNVRISEKFCRPWRLTLDEENDLILLNQIYSFLNVGYRAVNFDELVRFFSSHPKIEEINFSNFVKYRDDRNLIAQLKKATTFKIL